MRERGGVFVEAVRLTRMPMLVTDATLPGNPITFANAAFIALSGYALDDLLGQDPHFMNGAGTDPAAITAYQAAIRDGRDKTLEIVQYRKDGQPFRAMLFASPLEDGEGRVIHHFLSYLDITRRHDAEAALRTMTTDLEARVAERTGELEAVNAQLRAVGAEREMLMVEVNHRAKNSLMIAASLLAIQGRRQSDPGVRVLFDEAQDRLGAMARVHDMLAKSETSQRVDIALYLTELCEALKSSADGERIRLETQVEAGILVDAETAFPLGIVVTELITNAVKYAFPPPRLGSIIAQARRSEPGWAELHIRDDGVGMSNFREGSLGYGLVRTLVQQIKGDLAIESADGVTVRVSFPAPPAVNDA